MDFFNKPLILKHVYCTCKSSSNSSIFPKTFYSYCTTNTIYLNISSIVILLNKKVQSWSLKRTTYGVLINPNRYLPCPPPHNFGWLSSINYISELPKSFLLFPGCQIGHSRHLEAQT